MGGEFISEFEIYDVIIAELRQLYGFSKCDGELYEYVRLRHQIVKIYGEDSKKTIEFFILDELNIPHTNHVCFNQIEMPIYGRLHTSIQTIVELWEFNSFGYANHLKKHMKEVKSHIKKIMCGMKVENDIHLYRIKIGLDFINKRYGAQLSSSRIINGFVYPLNHQEFKRSLEEFCSAYIDAGQFFGEIFEKHPESVIEELIYKNLEKIEVGLTLIQLQYKIKNARLDILAKDINGNYVIIEIKTRNSKDMVWQSIYYPEQFKKEKKVDHVRFLLIAPNYSYEVISALKMINGIEIFKYKTTVNDKMKISFEQLK